jgi:predicted DNA-binding transcriptional regulator YafY
VRLLHLHRRLSAGQPVTAAALAKELELSERTLRRDFARMTDELGVQVHYDESAHTWTYREVPDFLSARVRLTAAERAAIAMAGARLGEKSGGRAVEEFLAAMRKIDAVVDRAISVPVETLTEIVEGPVDHASETEQRLFPPLLEAQKSRAEVRIRYAALGKKARDFVVHPLFLTPRVGRWILLATLAGTEKIMTFMLARMSDVAETGRAFAPPANFDARRYLRGSMGRFAGTEEIEVRVALTAIAAATVAETRWLPDQELTPLPDGRTQVRLRVNNSIEILHEVLRCGPHAEVLSPPELRAQAREMLERALAHYA